MRSLAHVLALALALALIVTSSIACASTPPPLPPPPPPPPCPSAPAPFVHAGYPLTLASSAIQAGTLTPRALDGIARPALILSRAEALRPWLGTSMPSLDALREERRVLLFEPRALGLFDVRLVEVLDPAARAWCLPPAVDRVTGEAITPTVNAVLVDVADDTWGLAAAPVSEPQEHEREPDEGEWDRCEGMTGHQRSVCECMRKAKSPGDCRMP